MKVRLSLPGLRAGTDGNEVIRLDDARIEHAVRGLTLYAEVGEPTRLHLDLLLRDGVHLDGDVTVTVPSATRDALIALGWTPPPDAGPAADPPPPDS